MDKCLFNPPEPNMLGLSWRAISSADLPALVELAQAVYRADGGLALMFASDMLKSRYFPDGPGRGMGAFTADGRLAACAAVQRTGDPGAERAVLVGMVRPDLRNQGIGAYLMRWSQAQAETLLAEVAGNPKVWQISTESLTEGADQLYKAHGFTQVFGEQVMRFDLRPSLPEQPLPPGVTLVNWQAELGPQFFQAYEAAFRERPGFPGYSAEEWIANVPDDDYRPIWSFLALAGDVPAGFVNSYIVQTTQPVGGYISQIGVIPAQRRRGLASALLIASMRQMQSEGLTTAELVVNFNNPGAIETYRRLGFTTVGCRARYERGG